MKFRPLCIDYQGEALYFEEEKSRQAGKKRSVIWIQNPSFSNTREINHSKTKNASACRPTRTGLVPRSASIVQTTSTSTTVLTDQRHTNDDQISATVSPTPIKDDRQKSNGKYRAKGEECFVAVFKPPRAFLDWMGNNSPVTKKRKLESGAAVLPFGDLWWQDGDWSLEADSGPPTTPARGRHPPSDKKEYFKILYDTPWLLELVSMIRRQVNRKRLTEKPCFMDPRLLVLGVVDLDPVSKFMREKTLNHFATVLAVMSCTTRHDRTLEIWHKTYGYRPKAKWLFHELPRAHRALFVRCGLVDAVGPKHLKDSGNFGKKIVSLSTLQHAGPTIDVSLEGIPSYLQYLSSRTTERSTREHHSERNVSPARSRNERSFYPLLSRRASEHSDFASLTLVNALASEEGRSHSETAKKIPTLSEECAEKRSSQQIQADPTRSTRVCRATPTNVMVKTFWNRCGEGDSSTLSPAAFQVENDSKALSQDGTRTSDQSVGTTTSSKADRHLGQHGTSCRNSEPQKLSSAKMRENILLERFGLKQHIKDDPKYCSDFESDDEIPSIVAGGTPLPDSKRMTDPLIKHRDSPMIKELLFAQGDSTNIPGEASGCLWSNVHQSFVCETGLELLKKSDDLNCVTGNEKDLAGFWDQSSTEWFPGPDEDASENASEHCENGKRTDDKDSDIPSCVSVPAEMGKKRKQWMTKESRKKEKKKSRKRRKRAKKKEDDSLETPRKMEFREVSPVKKIVESTVDYQLTTKYQPMEGNSDNRESVEEDKCLKESAVSDFTRPSETSGNQEPSEFFGASSSSRVAMRLFCSEKFLEDFGHVVADLARGDLFEGLVSRVHLIDTPLMDATGVHIELPHKGAIVVFKTSEAPRSGNEALTRITQLAASSRYQWLEIILCVDLSLDSTTAMWITRLQRALLVDEGFPGTKSHFTITSMHSLSTTIANSILTVDFDGEFITASMEKWLSNIRTLKRLDFLLVLLPCLSVSGAMIWLESVLNAEHSPEIQDEQVSNWFNRLFVDTGKEERRLSTLFSSNVRLREEIGTCAFLQLRLLTRTKGTPHLNTGG